MPSSAEVVLSLPEQLPIAAIELRPNAVVGVSRSPFTGKAQVYRWPGQWWEASVTLPPMRWEQAKLWQAFFTALNGPEGVFTLPMDKTFRNTGITGAAAHGWRVKAGAQVGSTWLPVERISGSNAAGSPDCGDYLYISSAGGSFLHQVVGGVSVDSQGHATGFDMWPRLRAPMPGHSFAFLAQGAFRLRAGPVYTLDAARITQGLTIELVDAAAM